LASLEGTEGFDGCAVNIVGIIRIELGENVSDVITPTVRYRVDGNLDFHVGIFLVETSHGVRDRFELSGIPESH
jgi:hypothetical protein